jgi:hypothetical protein
MTNDGHEGTGQGETRQGPHLAHRESIRGALKRQAAPARISAELISADARSVLQCELGFEARDFVLYVQFPALEFGDMQVVRAGMGNFLRDRGIERLVLGRQLGEMRLNGHSHLLLL